MSTNAEKNKFPIFQKRFNSLRGEMSQADFASKIGISRPTVGFYENGERLPDALVLKKIADKCNTSVDWLLGITDADSKDVDIQAIHKATGLSIQAIQGLNIIDNMRAHGVEGTRPIDTVNLLFSGEISQFDDFMLRPDVDFFLLLRDYLFITDDELKHHMIVDMEELEDDGKREFNYPFDFINRKTRVGSCHMRQGEMVHFLLMRIEEKLRLYRNICQEKIKQEKNNKERD